MDFRLVLFSTMSWHHYGYTIQPQKKNSESHLLSINKVYTQFTTHSPLLVVATGLQPVSTAFRNGGTIYEIFASNMNEGLIIPFIAPPL